MAGHDHLCLSIPPKYSVSQTIGLLEGDGAVLVHRELTGHLRVIGLRFWATGNRVSGFGFDKAKVREYAWAQEKLENGQGDFDFK